MKLKKFKGIKISDLNTFNIFIYSFVIAINNSTLEANFCKKNNCKKLLVKTF